MVSIKLFDTFEILQDGTPILENLLNTRKTKLFIAYIILNKDRNVTQKELFELLWSGQEYSNPGTALRTLLYRYRSLISENNVSDLEDSILSKRNAYQWNSENEILIDIYDFDDYAAIGLNKTIEEDKRVECLKKAYELYKGTLLNDLSGEHWVVSKAVYYREKYISVVFEYVDILKRKGDFENAVDVVTKALSIIGKNELLETELELVKNQGLSDEESSKYEEMKTQMQEMDDEVFKLQRILEVDNLEPTAYVCTFDVFQSIYQLQRRLLARTGDTIYVSLLTVGYPKEFETDVLHHERYMNALLDTAKHSLRCGDTICRYSDNKLAILFPAGSYEDAANILKRIKTIYMSKVPGENLVITYRVKPLKSNKE